MPKWLEKWERKLKTPSDCVRFVDDTGFCTIDPALGFPDFPNQADAMGVDMAIGHTWFWKDDLHIQKRLFYTRLLFSKPGYISTELLPAFIATNGQVADELEVMGRMPVTQKAIYDILEQFGPISTRKLKEMVKGDVKRQASDALISLEKVFIATKTDITGRRLSTYSYVWDLAERWVPEAFEEADRLGSKRARAIILERLEANGVGAEQHLQKAAFGW